MYQPEDRPNIETNLGSILGSIALFTIFHKSAVKGLTSVSRLIGRHAGRLIRGLGTPAAEAGYRGLLSQAVLRSSALSKLAGGPATSMADLSIGRLARPLAGELLGLASSRSITLSRGVAAVQTGYRQIRRERLSYFGQAGVRGLELRRAMRGQFHPRDMDMRRKLLSGYFKADGGFSKRFMGSALAWGADYAKAVPGLYIADQALGLFSEERRKQAPAWYNIPGHLTGMVRFGVAFAPAQLAFKGLGAGVLHSKDALAESARKFISRRPGSRQTIHKLFSTEGMIGNVRATTLAFGQAVVERERMGWGVSLQPLRFRGSSYNVFDMVNRAIKLRKEIGKPTFGVEREMKQILDQVQAVKTNVNVDPELFRVASESSPIREAFGRLTSKYMRAPKKSMLAHAMGYEPKTKTTFQFIDEYAKKSGWSAAEAGEIRKMVGEKKLYLGTNIMEQGNFGMLSAAYATDALTSMIGRARVPVIGWAPWERWARQRKMGAFEVIDDQRSILQAADHPLRGIDRVAKPHQGEVYLRVGDTMFSVAPYNTLDPVRPLGPPGYKGRGKMLYLTSSERAQLVGSTEITTDQKKGWFSRVTQRFELGQDQSFVGRKLGRWLTREFDPRSPHVLTGPGGRLEGMLKSSESLTPETLEEFKTYVGMIRRTFQGGQSKAFEILDREGSLRNKILDIIGVPEARRTFRDNQMESMFTELRGMLSSPSDIRSPNAERLNRQIDRAMGMVGSSADAGYQWHSRASSVSESNAITTGAWLKGQYFTKLLEGKRSLKTGQIHPKLLERLYKSVDEASLSRRNTAHLKSLFTGTSFEGSLSKLESTSKGLAPIDMFSDLRSTVLDHWEAIQGAFSKPQIGRSPFATLYDSNSRIMNELGSGTADNRLWLMGTGRKAVIPGFFDDFKKMVLGQPSSGPEPYITQNSLRLNRWAISPMNRTLGFVGLDLSYNSNADFLRKFATKRLLAIPAAIYGYRALDTAVAAIPFLNHTIFDDGTTSAGAEVIAKANLLRAGLFDKVGITSAAQYLEGLFPGSIESPAAKIARGAFPLFLGKAIGGRTGFFMGAGLSTITGFGLPDLTRTHDELSDIYSGKELVPVRKGRFWELCITEDALVRTPNRLVPAKDVSIDDTVFDKRGNEVIVLDTAMRKLEKDEHVFEIVPKYFPEFPLKCTGDHTIYISRRGREKWVKACDIQPGDHLLYPLRKFDSGIIRDKDVDIPTNNLYELGRLIGIHTGIGRVNDTHLDLEFNEYQLDVALSISTLIEQVFGVDPELIITSCGYILRCEKDEISGILWTITRFGTDETIEKFYHASMEFRNGFLCGLIEVCGGMDQEDKLHIVLERKRQNVTIFIIDALLSIGVIPEHNSIELFVDGKDRIFDRFIIAPEYIPYIVPKCRYMRLDLPDEFPSKNLKDVYTCAEVLYHPIKECRRIQYSGYVYDFWVGSTASFCAAFGIYHNSKGPFAGGKITSWVPSWYTRIKSQYRYTDTALGSKTEALLYTGPLSLLGATDPYHYERCVAKGTPVVTSDGIRNVEDISKDDIILAHDGSYRKVLGAWSKLIDELGVSFYSISLPTTTTPEHRYYTISPSGKYAWERADQLTTRHWMVMPRPRYHEFPRIDLLSYFPGYKHDKDRIYKGSHSIKRWIVLDEHFGLFIGLYIRKLEGGAKVPFRIASRGNESIPLQSLVQHLSWHCFGIALDKLVDNRLYLEFMKRFGNTGHPRFPNEMLMANRDFMCGLLKGILAEHAGYSPKRSYWTQRNLVLNILHILLSFGVYAGVEDAGGRYEFIFPENQNKNIRALFSNKIYVPISDNDVHFTENEIHFRVQRVKKELYTGKIYDLQIDGSYSFVGDCCSFHNTRYNERPYPLTAPPFHNVPVIGPMLNTTVGRIVKPQQLMHEDELDAAYLGMDSEVAEGIAPGINGPQLPSRIRGPNGAILGKAPVRTSSLSYAYGESLYRFTEAIGLRGFLAQTALGGEGANAYQPVYEDASSITSHAKQFWDLQVGGLGGLCFDGSTLISTISGYKPISEIETDEQVITQAGIETVLAKIKRNSNSSDRMVCVKLNSHPCEIRMTDNHLVLAHRTKYHWVSEKPHRPYKDEMCSHCNKQFEENLEFIPIGKLKPGDFLVTQIPRGELDYTIDFAKYHKSTTQDYVYSSIVSNEYARIYELLEENPTLTRKQLRRITTDAIAKEVLRSIRYHSKPKRWPRYLELTEDLAYLIGWWIAEGSVEIKGRIQLVMHAHEFDIAKRLEDIIKKRLGISSDIKIVNNTLVMRFSHKPFANFLRTEFGSGAHHKHIPYKIKNLRLSITESLLDGLISGDGWENEKNQGYTTVSRQLILDVIDLYARFDELPSICGCFVEGIGYYPQGTKRQPMWRYYLETRKTNHHTSKNFIFNGKIYKKIKSIVTIQCPDALYDLSIENNHNYIANGMIVHNSEGLRRFYPRSRTRNLQNPIRNCLTEDSLIRVNKDSSVRADEVKMGDNLSSLTTPLSKVENIFIRDVQNEKIYRIFLNSNSKPPGITGEHPVYAIKSSLCHDHPERNPICWKGRAVDRCSACGYGNFNENRYGTHKYYLDYKPGWIDANELKPGDFVGYVIHDTDESLPAIDLANLLGNIMLNPKKQVNRPLYEYDNQKIWTTYGASKQLNDRKQDRFLVLDYRFGYLCGLWLSEGSKTGGPGQFYFALHSNERETLGKELEDILREYKIITNSYIRNNALRITANSRMFLDILTKLFGRGSLTKYISGYIISSAPKKFLAGILHGMFEGDGTIRGMGSTLKLSSASRNLILSTRDILLQFRIVSSIHETSDGQYILSILHGSNEILPNVFDSNYGYKISEKIKLFTKPHTTNMPHWFDGNILFMVIRKIEIENYSGPLYDYHIPNGNSFHSEMMLLHNSQPTWLPDEFQYGDPIGRIDNGLLLLPSKAYEATHSVRHTFPMAVDYLGYDPRESALRYIGVERGDPVEVHQEGPMREYIQAELAKRNMLTAKDVPVFAAATKIDGHIDAMVRMETGGTAPMQIKASTAEQLGGMNQPLPAHVSQINFLMRMAKKRIGQITYVAADNPDLQKTFTIEYSQERYRNDMERVDQARVLASGMLKNGIGYAGESYSYPDRLVVLANIAPTGQEYKETLKKVQALQRYGRLDEEDQRKVAQAKRIRNSVLRQYDMYPRRFSFGKIMTPSSEYNLMSENRNIKAASEYSLLERVLGGVWESFTSTQIPFVSRFYGTMTPEEMYKSAVFGSTTSMWAHPVRDFVNPATQSFLQSNDPFEGARKLGVFGALVGGPPGALVGAGAGALYGALRSPFSDGVPAGVQKTRDVTTYFDAIKYVKGMQAYSQTGDPAHLDDAKSTIFGLDEQSSTSQLYEAIPYKERPFLWTFAKTQDMTERRKILKMVSPTMARVLQFIWNDKKGRVTQDIVEYTARNEVPARSWEGWNAGVPLEDVQLVSLEHEGLNAFDYGKGWHDQRSRMYNTYTPKPISLSNPSGMSETPEVTIATLRRTLSNLLSEYGIRNVSMNVIEGAPGSTIVNLLVKV